MSNRFYYDPKIRYDDGVYSANLFVKTRCGVKKVGTMIDHSYLKLMERVRKWSEGFEHIKDNRNVFDKITEYIQNKIRRNA